MTDDKKAAFEKQVELEKLKADTEAKKAQYDNKIYSAKLKTLEQNEEELAVAQKASYGALTEEELSQIIKENDEYLDAAQSPMVFISPAFNKKVPFFRKNLILVAGQTGEGKSTAVSNIAFSNLTTKSKKTGKTLRTLIITNEEKREDLYNRITCLIRGWHYTNHSGFTMEQRKEFNRMIGVLSSDARLTIIDDGHGGSQGVTTTIEGIEAIFTRLIEDKEYYDVIIIDYYQNVAGSKLNPGLDQYKVQERLSNLLNNFKNIYPAPIVIMAQLKAQDQSNKEKVPFQLRLMGSKRIMVPCTFAVEMVIDRENLRTKWVVHKSRYTEAFSSKDFFTGYDNGKFVEYTTAFAENVQRMAYEKLARKNNEQIDKGNGLPDVFKQNTSEEKKSDPTGTEEGK